MRPSATWLGLARWAPVSAGALLLGAMGLLALSSGKEDAGTPEWRIQPTQAIQAPERHQARSGSGTKAAGTLCFVSYNLENWLTMERGQQEELQPKPDSEKEAAVSLLVAQQADVLGIQEIGTAEDLADLQRRLLKAGLDLPHTHLAEGSDRVRRLGLLSRFPIQVTRPAARIDWNQEGRRQMMNRGILDASVEVNGSRYRFIGVHFKSRREVAGLDQEQMRMQEAHALRRHLDGIFRTDAAARLVVYGDFNDTLRSAAVRTVMGNRGETGALEALRLGDGRGHAWTHHWRSEDVYSRIDYVALSRGLSGQWDRQSSRVVDDPGWEDASDHRPLRVVFKSP